VPPTELRPRSATEIIDAAFQILKQQYGTFVVLAALAYLPYIVLMLAVSASAAGGSPEDQFAAAVGVGMITLPLALIWFPVAECAVVVGASDALLGKSVEPGTALRTVLSRFFSVLGAAIFKGLLVFAATLFFLIPGMIVWLGLFATPAVVVFEKLAAAESIGRSWALSKGMKLKVLGVMLIAYILVSAVQFAVDFIAQIAGLNPIMGSVASSVLVIFIYPLIGICTALLYYDARIRKEGFDLQVLASELERAEGAEPYAARP
jgi:hypothetical protein